MSLHSSVEIRELWEATCSVLHASVPSSFVCLCLRPFQLRPGTIFRDKFAFRDSAELKRFTELSIVQPHIAAHPGIQLVRLSDIISDAALVKTPFYRECMKPCDYRYFVAMVFWDNATLAGVICLHRAKSMGDFTAADLETLVRLQPHFAVAVTRVVKLHASVSVRLSLEKFMQFLPLPTALLNWELTPIYHNKAALHLSAEWQFGPEHARVMKLSQQFEIPADLQDFCQALRDRWNEPHPQNFNLAVALTETYRHPQQPALTARISLLQFNAAPSQRPTFLIQFENTAPVSTLAPAGHFDSTLPAGSDRLRHLAQLTPAEQQLALLMCDGLSNQEIAGKLGKSPLTVKKQLQSIFHKLEVPSRSRLIAILR